MTTKKKEVSKKAPARTKPHGSATAAAILGRATVKPGQKPGRRNGEFKVKAEWAKFYQRLLELREQLMRQMTGLAKESAQEMAGYSLHMADSGTDNFDRDFALSLLSSDQDAIYEIEEALKRIERNTYGTSVIHVIVSLAGDGVERGLVASRHGHGVAAGREGQGGRGADAA